MTYQLTRWDYVFFVLMVIGLVASVFNIIDGRVTNGLLGLGAVVIGLAVRVSLIRNPEVHETQPGNGTGRSAWESLKEILRGDEDLDRSAWLQSGIIAGFVATTIMSGVLVLGYLSSGIFADENGNQISQWFYGLTHNSLTDNAFDVPIGYYAINLLAGIVWALVYAYWVEPRLSGPAWRRGVMFSLIPWILSLVVFFPLVGAGFLGLDLDAGPLPAIGNLILHLAYGFSLGVMYAIPTTRGIGAHSGAVRLARWEDRGLAMGLVLGLVGGAALGLVIDLVINTRIDSTELILAGASVGVLAGAIIGPFLGMDYSDRDQRPSMQ
jgi:hypothetical protein